MALPVVAGAVAKTVGKASVKKAIGAVAVKRSKGRRMTSSNQVSITSIQSCLVMMSGWET